VALECTHEFCDECIKEWNEEKIKLAQYVVHQPT